MVQLESVEAIQVLGQSVSLSEFLSLLHRQGRLQKELQLTWLRKALYLTAEELGLRPDRAQLQIAADRFRRTNGLLTSQEMHGWLKQRRLDVVDFETLVEDELVRGLVFNAVTQHAREQFEKSREHWDVISLTILQVSSEGLALELMAQIREDGIDFSTIVSEHSAALKQQQSDLTQRGFRGHVERAIFDAVATAVSGDIVGPVPAKNGWAIVQLQAVKPAEFDAETESEIRKQLFHRWMITKLRGEPVSYPLLDLISCHSVC